jgi:hypothetical protein
MITTKWSKGGELANGGLAIEFPKNQNYYTIKNLTGFQNLSGLACEIIYSYKL